MKKGLIIINTGDGKGKTTAAFGLALRAMGHGKKALIIQFIKGSWKYGESESFERFSDLMDFRIMGRGFTFKSEDIEKDKEKAMEAWRSAETAIHSGNHDLIILDEITYPLNYGMIPVSEVVDALLNRPKNLHVVLTGRNAPAELCDIADTITEMKAIKHHYKNGVKAQKGIEF